MKKVRIPERAGRVEVGKGGHAAHVLLYGRLRVRRLCDFQLPFHDVLGDVNFHWDPHRGPAPLLHLKTIETGGVAHAA